MTAATPLPVRQPRTDDVIVLPDAHNSAAARPEVKDVLAWLRLLQDEPTR